MPTNVPSIPGQEWSILTISPHSVGVHSIKFGMYLSFHPPKLRFKIHLWYNCKFTFPTTHLSKRSWAEKNEFLNDMNTNDILIQNLLCSEYISLTFESTYSTIVDLIELFSKLVGFEKNVDGVTKWHWLRVRAIRKGRKKALICRVECIRWGRRERGIPLSRKVRKHTKHQAWSAMGSDDDSRVL